MSVYTSSFLVYHCVCDVCGRDLFVKSSEIVYNRAQAVRSLGWSYGKDRIVRCDTCRIKNLEDNYAKRPYF